MKRTRRQRKEQLIDQAEVVIDELLEWGERNSAPSLAEIEEVILRLRKRMGEQMAQAVLSDQEQVRPVPGPSCPRCGREMQYKDQKANAVESRVGTLKVECGYYYCPDCKEGLFPPG